MHTYDNMQVWVSNDGDGFLSKGLKTASVADNDR